MKIEGTSVIITKTDLDHILNIDILAETKDVPPSEIFLEGLNNELLLAYIDPRKVTEIVIKL